MNPISSTAGHLQAGPYRLVEQLSSGGESHVWSARHATEGTPVVVKVQRTEVRPERLRREAAVLYALRVVDVPNVVRLLPGEDGQQVSDQPGVMRTWGGQEVLYCALEPLPCGPANNLIKQLPLKGRDVVAICDALRRALRVMHLEFEMIHNDLKPDNIAAWRERGKLEVRLFDFGQAALLRPHPRSLSPCISPEPAARYVYDYGSRPYQAPERWHGRSVASQTDPESLTSLVDDRADQWSFAATVFKLLTGRTLVAGQSEEQIQRTILDGGYFSAIDAARLPVGAKAALTRALALNQADRYPRSPSVSGLDFFCRDLEAALA